MVTYNPKQWMSLIFHSYSKRVLYTLWPALSFMAVYSAVLCYILIYHFDIDHAHFQPTVAMHQLLGVVLGLFLVFRTNTAYDRWWEGRRLWGSMVNSTRTFAMKVNAAISTEDHETRDWFAKMIVNFVFAMKESLRTGVQLAEMDPPDENFLNDLKKFKHKPNRIAALMHRRVNEMYRSGKITGDQLINMDKELKDFLDNLGACERIKNTPIPYSYMMYVKKFIFIYIITLPFGFLSSSGYLTIPIVVLISFILLSIELIAEEIEDPFGRDINDLPLDELSGKIRENVREILLS
jgi:ion channel-forming bestrophin family protein